MLICPTIQHARCRSWLQRHAPPDGSVVVADITSLYTALCVMGPLARELLSEVTDQDLSPRSFPFFTFKVSLVEAEELFFGMLVKNAVKD